MICPKCKLDILNSNTHVIAEARMRKELERLRIENKMMLKHIKGMNKSLARRS